MCGSDLSYSEPLKPQSSPKKPSKIVETAKKLVKASGTTGTRALLQAAVKKIQRSNTWTTGRNIEVVMDSKKKERHAFDATGAICAVLADKLDTDSIETAKETKKVQQAMKAMEKTLRSNPARYGSSKEDDLTSFNDSYDRTHAQVVKLFNDTINRLS